MGVFATDRWSGEVFGASNRLWGLLGACVGALGGFSEPGWDLRGAWTRDGYVPARLAHQWGAVLFSDLGDIVLSCRPEPRFGPGLHPMAVFRRGGPEEAAQRRLGEQLSAYETDLAVPALRLAQLLTTSAGMSVWTLRPPAGADARSPVAARRWLVRSGVLHDPRPQLPRRQRLPVPEPPGHPRAPAPRIVGRAPVRITPPRAAQPPHNGAASRLAPPPSRSSS